MSLQNSLFAEEPTISTETLDEVNQDLLVRGRALPDLANRFFVFGEGAILSRVAVVGESPGAPDANSGLPFQGPAGEMLEKVLGSIGLRRAECYLTNAVKIISGGDEITPEILNFFAPFLHRELAVVKPQIVVALGNTAMRVLLNKKKPISQMRGTFHDYKYVTGAKLMPTFNPAYLLRDPTKKREVWEDMKSIRAALNELDASKK